MAAHVGSNKEPYCARSQGSLGHIASLSDDLLTATCVAHKPQRDEPQRQAVTHDRQEKTTPFSVNLMRSQVLYRAAQVRQ